MGNSRWGDCSTCGKSYLEFDHVGCAMHRIAMRLADEFAVSGDKLWDLIMGDESDVTDEETRFWDENDYKVIVDESFELE